MTKIRDFDQNHEFLSVLSTQKELQIENIFMGQKIPDIQNTTLFCNLKSPTRTQEAFIWVTSTRLSQQHASLLHTVLRP